MSYKSELRPVVVKTCMVGTLPLLGKDFVKNAMSLHHSTNRMNKNFFLREYIYLPDFISAERLVDFEGSGMSEFVPLS